MLLYFNRLPDQFLVTFSVLFTAVGWSAVWGCGIS